ncbi:MAG: tRNA dihydrouridine synthase DusB [Rhodospirillaceae bacterium]|nr:tRNA dihydrouridine synthase DusB [Rhodospirillaceae bacterium]
MGICLDQVHIDPPVILAPMSGVTDLPFRRLVRRLGGGLVVSEMIASREMLRAAQRMRRSSTDCAEEWPMVVQLAGDDPGVMADAARLNVDRGAAVIDINFGCPAKKVVNKACGAAMMREPDLATRIMAAVVRAVPVPVTVKMRTGWDADSRTAPHLARAAEAVGVRLVTVHGRTRSDFYSGRSDWSFIRQVKEAVGIPVVANGDIAGPEDIDRCLEASGADGIMIGRAAQGRPWLIGQAAEYLRSGQWPAAPEPAARGRIAREHLDGLLSHYGLDRGLRIARKHLGWYAAGLPDATTFRDKINRMTDHSDVFSEIAAFFAPASARLAA